MKTTLLATLALAGIMTLTSCKKDVEDSGMLGTFNVVGTTIGEQIKLEQGSDDKVTIKLESTKYPEDNKAFANAGTYDSKANTIKATGLSIKDGSDTYTVDLTFTKIDESSISFNQNWKDGDGKVETVTGTAKK